MREPLDHDGRRQNGLAPDHVRLEERVVRDTHGSLQGELQVPSRGAIDIRTPVPGIPKDDDLYRLAGFPTDLLNDVIGSRVQWDQSHALTFEELLQGRCNHPAFPGSPVDGPHAAVRPKSRLLLGQFVQDFVGGRIVRLPFATEARGG